MSAQPIRVTNGSDFYSYASEILQEQHTRSSWQDGSKFQRYAMGFQWKYILLCKLLQNKTVIIILLNDAASRAVFADFSGAAAI